MSATDVWAIVGAVLLVAAAITWGVAEISDHRREKAQKDHLDEWSL